MFHIRQRVVCIKDHPEWKEAGCSAPVVGGLYRNREFDGTEGVRLIEIVNPKAHCMCMVTKTLCFAEPSFWLNRFRPIIERKTDISIFTEILNKINNKVEV